MVVIRKQRPSKAARARNLNTRRRAAARLQTRTTVPSVVELRNFSPTYAEAATSPLPVEENEEVNELLNVIGEMENVEKNMKRERRMLLEERREDKEKILALEAEVASYRERIMGMDVTLAQQKEETRRMRSRYNIEHDLWWLQGKRGSEQERKKRMRWRIWRGRILGSKDKKRR